MRISHIAGAALAAGALLLCRQPAAAAADAHSQRVILNSGAAMGVAALRSARVIRLQERVGAVGLSGTQTQWLGISSSQLAESAVLPPLNAGDGYDGSVAWNRDQSGLVWNDGSAAGRSTAITAAYVATYGLWKPNAGGASVTYQGVKNEKGRAYDALQVIAPGSKLPAELWFDRSTHLLSRMRQAVGPVVNTTTFANYRRVHGLMVPSTVHVQNTNGNNTDVTLESVVFNPPDGAVHLARPASSVHDYSMQNGRTSTTVPFDLVDNHVYVDVMLNGKGPYHMIFDTGGSNIVDPAVAKEIGALGKGNLQGSGVGAKTEQFSFATVDSLQVGDALVRQQLFAVAPVRAGFGISAGRTPDGLIGWEVLARYVTTFDYANRRIVFTMPGTSATAQDAHVIPFVFNGTQPQIACGINGIASDCTIDTGARDTMTFYAPFLAEHPQVQPTALSANGVTGFGVGGPSMGRLGRVQTVSIGDLTLHDLVGDFSASTQGAFANPFTAANLGGNLLRRFNVTFDYGHETMSLVPNVNFGQRDSYERSGLFLLNSSGKIIVVDARPGTPAADAGIAKGDTITSIDGTPASALTLAKAREFFTRAAGTVVKLGVVDKAGAARTVSLTLRDYV